MQPATRLNCERGCRKHEYRELIHPDIMMARHIAHWTGCGSPGGPAAQRLLIEVYAQRIVNTDANGQEILASLEVMTQAQRLQLTAER